MRLPAARQSGPRPASHVLSSSRILLFTQLIPELVCDPISRHFILSCLFPGAPPVHYGMLRPQVPFSLPGAVAGGTRSPGYPPKGGGGGGRGGNEMGKRRARPGSHWGPAVPRNASALSCSLRLVVRRGARMHQEDRPEDMR